MSRALGAAAALSLLGFVLTLDRVPIPWPDAQLYASIARARQLYGIGVPSTLLGSPAAVDHLPFYGPVYIDLVALSFDTFGFSLRSSRLVNIAGALVIAGAAAVLARAFGGDRARSIGAAALVLLTVEIGAAATNGTMETLAVGFELMAMAMFVRGLVRARSAVLPGVAAGLFLALAALTTPRAYPFVVAMLVSGALASIRGSGAMSGRENRTRPRALAQLAWAAGVLSLVWCAWTTRVHGSPLRWFDYFIHIVSREDTDVAWLATSVRTWAFNWPALITPACALAASAAAALALARRPAVEWVGRGAAWFALVTAWLAGALTFSGMNITWTLGIYFAMPLFVVTISLPWAGSGFPRQLAGASLALWLGASASVALLRHARTAVTWEARDPAPLTRFVARHVPPGSIVVGPDALYFFAVESNGSRYRSWLPASMADWARWAPAADGLSLRFAPPAAGLEPAMRFFIWQAADDLPDGYACAAGHRLGIYEPPANHLYRLGRFGDVWDAGYPETALYRLPDGCPTGYDPTRSGP